MFVGKVGNDDFGGQVLNLFEEHGLDINHITRSKTHATGIGLIQVEQATGENAIVVAPGANHDFTDADLSGIQLKPDDVVVAQFEVPMARNETLFRRARDMGTMTVLNPAPMMPGGDAVLDMTSVLVVNETELAMLSGRGITEDSSIHDVNAAALNCRRHENQTVVVTLGERGVLAVDSGGRAIRVPGHSVQAVDTTGAGDCFVGCLAQALAAGLDMKTAITRANLAASISVTVPGAASSLPTANQIDAAMDD
jgi:ribokinase